MKGSASLSGRAGLAAGLIRDATAAGRLDGLLRQLQAERERWALWLPVAFALGIAIYFALPSEPPAALAPSLLVVAALAGLARRRHTLSFVLALTLGSAALGFALAQWHTERVAAPVLAKRLGPVAVSGEVHALSAPGKGGRVILRRLEIADLAPEATPERVRLRVASEIPPEVTPGDRVTLRAVLQPPPRPAAPGAFDFARQAYFQRIGAVGYAVSRVTPDGPGEVGAERGWRTAWQTLWADWRQAVVHRVLAVLPEASGGIAAALMTGERGAIPAPVIDAMRESGLAHLLAISGLHMGLVAGWLFFAVRAALAAVPAVALRYPIKKWAALAAMAGGVGYLLLVGATVPAQRAYVMVLLVLLAVLLDRSAISLRLVAWAAFAILAVAPHSLLGASFQMSFAAVVALVAAYEQVTRKGWLRGGGSVGGGLGGLSQASADVTGAAMAWFRRVGLYLAGVMLTSVIAILATAPFAIYNFNRMAWFGLAANLIAVPLTALWIMPLALLAFLLMPFGLEALALVPLGWGVDGVIAAAQTVSAWPGATSPVAALPPAGLALVVAGGLWLCLWQRPWRLAGLPVMAAGLLTLLLVRPPDVLVSGDAKLLGLREPEGGLWVSSGRKARYTADVWARRAGSDAPRTWPSEGLPEQGLRCDALGCLFHARGQTVALVTEAQALAEDCAVATAVIALEPVPKGTCGAPEVVIDRFDLWREGAHALWLSPEGIEASSARQVSGERPWVRRPEDK